MPLKPEVWNKLMENFTLKNFSYSSEFEEIWNCIYIIFKYHCNILGVSESCHYF